MVGKIVGFLALVFTFGSAVVTFYEFATRGAIPHASELAISYFFLLFVFSIVYLLVQDYRLGRKSRYAEVIGRVSQLYEYIQNAVARTGQLDTGAIREVCKHALDELAGVFDAVSSTKTATCIKLIQTKFRDETQLDDTIVVTFCRDSASAKARIEEDKRQHWLNDNTGFQSVWLNKGEPFFCNDLPGYAGYRNTSASGVTPWTVPPRRLWISTRWLLWPLKYRSTMVVAIRSDRIHGFLCVDSRSRGVFDSRYGIDILSGFSRVLSPLIAEHHRLASQSPTLRFRS